jgi:hypothetical protein
LHPIRCGDFLACYTAQECSDNYRSPGQLSLSGRKGRAKPYFSVFNPGSLLDAGVVVVTDFPDLAHAIIQTDAPGISRAVSFLMVISGDAGGKIPDLLPP